MRCSGHQAGLNNQLLWEAKKRGQSEPRSSLWPCRVSQGCSFDTFKVTKSEGSDATWQQKIYASQQFIDKSANVGCYELSPTLFLQQTCSKPKARWHNFQSLPSLFILAEKNRD